MSNTLSFCSKCKSPITNVENKDNTPMLLYNCDCFVDTQNSNTIIYRRQLSNLANGKDDLNKSFDSLIKKLDEGINKLQELIEILSKLASPSKTEDKPTKILKD